MDPKYAGLPGIATGQQDTFETFSDQDQDEESESEQSETLHLSSLSWLGGDLEIAGAEEKETMIQKFTRLRCEVTEFYEDLNSMAESETGNLAGLHKQVSQLQEQLEVCAVDQDGAPPATLSNQKDLLENLRRQIESISVSSEDAGPSNSASYELFLPVSEPVTPELLSRLDQRLAKLEKVVGPDPLIRQKVLSAGTDSLPLSEAVQVLENRKHTLRTEHLSHIEGRIASLGTKLNALKDQKEKVDSARTSTEVSKLYDALESRQGVVTVLPEVYERLQDLQNLHKNSLDWNSRCSETSSDQEKTETMLAENRSRIARTQNLLSEGLQGVTEKLEKLQASLQTLPA